MFISLLVVTFIVATVFSGGVAWAFTRPIVGILDRIVADKISQAWLRYMQFAIMVVGIGGGVRIYEIEQYITPRGGRTGESAFPLQLTGERWVLELYRTAIGTLQSVAWLLLCFFVVALIAYVVVRWAELRSAALAAQRPPAKE